MCGQSHESETAIAAPRQYEDAFPWHVGVFDAHNHIGERALTVSEFPGMKARTVSIMATRTQDQSLIEGIADSHGIRGPECLGRDATTTVVVGYGRHPWFSHELYDDSQPEPTYVPSDDIEAAKEKHYKAILTPSPEKPAFWNDLPTPIPLSEFIAETRERLKRNPLAMIGEVGLDKPFRLPSEWDPAAKTAVDPARTPGGRVGRPLSPHRIQMSHQKAVLLAHLRLAGELDRAISLHGVQVHGVLYDLLTSCWKGHEIKGRRSRRKEAEAQEQQEQEQEAETEGAQGLEKPFPPRICFHSFSGRSDAVKQYLKPSIPSKIFFSFSKTNNLASADARAKAEDAIGMVPDNRVLVETDIHTAGERMDGDLEEMYRKICEVKGWELEDGVRRIAANFHEFVFG